MISYESVPTAAPDGVTDLAFDVPSGRVVAQVECVGRWVHSVTVRNVASYVLAKAVSVETAKCAVHPDHQRSVSVFADGDVDRPPCGSGTAARVALLADKGRLAAGRVLTHESIIGTRFVAWVAEETAAEGRPAIILEVRGTALRTGEHVFVLDLSDDLQTGFVLQ